MIEGETSARSRYKIASFTRTSNTTRALREVDLRTYAILCVTQRVSDLAIVRHFLPQLERNVRIRQCTKRSDVVNIRPLTEKQTYGVRDAILLHKTRFFTYVVFSSASGQRLLGNPDATSIDFIIPRSDCIARSAKFNDDASGASSSYSMPICAHQAFTVVCKCSTIVKDHTLHFAVQLALRPRDILLQLLISLLLVLERKGTNQP